jgi:hypothetical protein
MDPQERMNLDGSLMFAKDSQQLPIPVVYVICSPNEKEIFTYEVSLQQDPNRFSNNDD